MWSRERIAETEPELRCVGGVFSPTTGIIDTHAYMLSLQMLLEEHGGMIAFNTPVTSLARDGRQVRVVTAEMEINANLVVNSGLEIAERAATGV